MHTQYNVALDNPEDSDDLRGRYLLFALGDRQFGVCIADVIQITELPSFTPVPSYPAYARGVADLRGEITPVIDLRARFGMDAAPEGERSCMIVGRAGGMSIGFVVDQVEEVVNIAETDITPPPELTQERISLFLTGMAKVRGKVTMLVDPGQILTAQEIEFVREATVAAE